MTPTDARAYIALHTDPTSAPALTEAEITACLNTWTRPDGSVWATRAIVEILDVKLSKVATRTDATIDGTTLNLSQLTDQLTRLRASWRSRCTPGSR